MKKYKILFIMIVLTVNTILINSQEEESKNEEKKTYIYFGFEYEQTVTYNSDSDFAVTRLYLTNDIYGSISLPVKFYTLTLWAEDEFIIDWNEGLFIDAISNGLYLGIENFFNVKDYINIGINYETDINIVAGKDVEVVFIPIINLNGSYNFGFSWEFEEKFQPAIKPYIEKEFKGDESFTGVTNEIFAEMNFEFFHFFAPEEISCSFHTEDTFTINFPYSLNIEEQTKTFTNEVEIGFDFSFYGFSPYLHIWMNPEHYLNYSDFPGHNVFNLGFTCGFEYSKKWFTFGIDYTGQRNVFLLPHDKPLWENEVEAWFLFSI